MKTPETNTLGTKSISSLLLEQAIPAGLGILVLSVYSLVDTIFIGQYIGKVGIAAITIIAPMTFLVSSVGLGIGMGGGSLISIALGENDRNKARSIVWHQLLLSVVFGAFFLIVGFLFKESLIKGFGGIGDSAIAASEYLYYTLLGLPFFLSQMTLNNILRAEGKSKAAMIVLGIPSILNILLDTLFIAYLDMGLTGAALATALSQLLGTLMGIYYLYASSSIGPKLSNMAIQFSQFGNIIRLGAVQFFSQASMSIVVILANNQLLTHGGEIAISGYGLAMRVTMFAFFPVIGVVQGFMPIAGYNHGAGLSERVSEAIKIAFKWSSIIALIITVLAESFPHQIALIFTDDPELIAMSKTVLIWIFSAYPLLGIQQICTSYFQAINKAGPALWLTLTKQAIIIPTLLFLPSIYGLEGIWYTFPISEVFTTIIAYVFFKKELNKQQSLNTLT